ncbi:MAG: hypothetical protein KAT04_12125 [Methylococcales bacterium]|nr:hypothetical protein [Methylococcales bacterium]
MNLLINKLYAKLTPNEQATLFFEAAVRQDENEVDLILNSVERRTYSTPHIDYPNQILFLKKI